LIQIAQAFEDWTAARAREEFEGKRYGDLKKRVADIVVAHLEPLQKRYREVVSEPGYLAGVLQQGADRVTPIADSTVNLVKQRMGLYAG
ncbi:MAG TPA: hypothetical protein VLT57_19015, partial [Bryobacteraceae bacterium]|nr:hypothetical protein [Bryobacteraceae bacterium]